MQSISTLAHVAMDHQGPAPEKPARQAVKNLFLLLQGSYGSLFLTKFATGVKDELGRDLGVRAAMAVWRATLAKYSPEVIEAAAGRLTADHPEFPPNLPQFEAICKAATPRKTYIEQEGLVRLPAPEVKPVAVSVPAQNDGKDWARRIVARHEKGDKTISIRSLKLARETMGLCP